MDEPAAILDAHVPTARQIDGRGAAVSTTGSRSERDDSSAWSRSATITSSPGDIMYGVTPTPVSDGRPRPPAGR